MLSFDRIQPFRSIIRKEKKEIFLLSRCNNNSTTVVFLVEDSISRFPPIVQLASALLLLLQ